MLTGAALAVIGPVPVAAPVAAAPVSETQGLDYRVHLRNRTIGASAKVDTELLGKIKAGGRKQHAVVQLKTMPHAKHDDGADLRAVGVDLLGYLGGGSGLSTNYLASIAPGVKSSDSRFTGLIRSVHPLTSGDRIDPALAKLGGDAVPALVQFFPDVSDADAAAILGKHRLSATRRSPGLWLVSLNSGHLHSLAAEDAVAFIQPGPPVDAWVNDGVRSASNVDTVQKLDTTTGLYQGLTGSGVQIGIMDSGVDNHHHDFDGRMIRIDHPGGDHGTHVAGIAAGSGVQSNANDDANNPNGGTAFQWRGMAPQAQIAAYGQSSGNASVFADAINNLGVDVTNHSYVLQFQGQYDGDVASVDTIVRGDSPGIPARPAVWAAANNANLSRDCDGDGINDRPQYPGGGCVAGYQTGYFSVLSPCKNCIDVAAVTKGQNHSSFSSIGPTMDGRLKPELAAVGQGVTSVGADTDSNGNATTGNNYRMKSGTSMASPAVTGMVALLLQAYQQEFGVNLDTNGPLPSTDKAILIQTAIDLQGSDGTTNPDTGGATPYGAGPDLATGFGLVDIDAAVKLLRARGFLQDSVSAANPTDEFPVAVVPGQTQVRVTLAWDDIAATPSGDDAAAKLVNDLDLLLIDPDGNVHRPLVLPVFTPFDCDGNAANGTQVGTCAGNQDGGQNFAAVAAEGTDRRNNVEQVLVTAPGGLEPGRWKARVSVLNQDGTTVRLPLGGTQSYSLAGVSTRRADLQVTKTDTPDPVNAGGELYYTVTVHNAGPDAATGAAVIDTLPAGVTYVTDTDGCVESPLRTLTCTVGDLAVGATKSFTIKVAVDPDLVSNAGSPVSLTNTVSAYSSTPDDTVADNTATAGTVVEDSADLAVTKICKPDTTIPAGQPILCTVFVDNHGPSYARGVVLTDTALSNNQFTMSGISASQGSCAAPAPVAGGQQIVCNLGNLANATTASPGRATVTYTMLSDEGADINNVATVRSDTPDPDRANNKAERALTVSAVANLSVTKTASPATATAGEPLTYTLHVHNSGPSTAAGVVVEDTLPDGLASISVTPGGGAASCTVGVPGDPAQPTRCSFGNLPSGADRTVTIAATVLPQTKGILHNDALVRASTFDSDLANNLAHVDTNVATKADLVITKVSSPNPVIAGTALDFTVKVVNNGPSVARSVSVTDALPSTLAFGSATISHGSGVCALVAGTPNTVQCELGDLNPADYVLVYVHTTVLASTPDSTVNNTVTTSSTTADPDGTSNAVTIPTTVKTSADLGIVLSSDADVYKPSATVAYKITVTNYGPSDARAVMVTDTLPTPKDAPYIFDSGGCTLSADAKTLTCSLGLIPAEATRTINVYVRVKGSKGQLTSTAALSSTTADPVAANNSSTRVVLIKGGV